MRDAIANRKATENKFPFSFEAFMTLFLKKQFINTLIPSEIINLNLLHVSKVAWNVIKNVHSWGKRTLWSLSKGKKK